MNFTQQLLADLFKKAQNFHPVRIGKLKQGSAINVKLGYGSVRAQALQDLEAGDAIAFQSDQGNWYLIGTEELQTNEDTTKKQIISRVVRPNLEMPTFESCELYLVKAWQKYSDINGRHPFDQNEGAWVPVPGTNLGNKFIYLSDDYKTFIQTLSKNQEYPSDEVLESYRGQYTRTINITDDSIDATYVMSLDQYSNLSDIGSAVMASKDVKLISFLSPTDSIITVNINFNYGQYAASSCFCGINIDTQGVIYNEPITPSEYHSIAISDTFDAISSSNSVSYTTTVTAGEHFINVQAAYNWNTNDIFVSLIDSFIYLEATIHIETKTKNQYFVQREQTIIPIANLERFLSDHTETDNMQLLKYYLTNTKKIIYFYIKEKTIKYDFDNFEFIHTTKVYRYILNKINNNFTEYIFTEPDEIPVLMNDWQKEWTTSYYPEPDTDIACINNYKNYREEKYVNFFKRTQLYIDVYQNTGNSYLLGLMLYGLKPKISAKLESYKYSTDSNTCLLTNKKKYNITLYKSQVTNTYDPDLILLLDMSITTT